MNIKLFAGAAVCAAWALASAGEVQPRSYYGRIARRLGDMLPQYHVLEQRLNDTVSQRAWTNLVTFYDVDHSVFLKSDIKELARHQRTLDDEILRGDVSFGYKVHELYVRRLRERVEFATNLLMRGEWDFTKDEMFSVKRKDVPWPATREEAEDYWRRRMKNEVLAQVLNAELEAEEKATRAATNAVSDVQGMTNAQVVAQEATNGVMSVETSLAALRPSWWSVWTNLVENATNAVEALSSTNAPAAKKDTPEQMLIKKYRQFATVLTEPDEEAVLQQYLSALARAYDPHTDYLSPVSKEDFDMDMNLTLCGVGAVLTMDDGALKIAEIMPGAPVARDGRIKVGDRIVGVQQGDGPMEDIMWQPMKKSISKIRGPKGTRVTLEVIPLKDPTGLTRKRYELVREEIKLEDQAATGRVERVESNGITYELGYIYLPGFYGTMDKREGDEGYRSSAQDVARWVAELNAEDIDGLILDLRGNGGGSLREAVALSSLFVSSGPVVQIRDVRSVGALPIPPGNPVAFRRPLVVMTDRASASASEIVAGHLRDTGRAIVLGDSRTHGKGTVQTVLGMGPAKYGSCKITTARFYRINGRSTQVEGVAADIHLPSLLDSLDIGEDKLPNALPFTRILKADYLPSWNMDSYLPELRKLSAERLAQDERYQRHLESVAGMKAISDRTEVPLERTARKAMMAADRRLREVDAEVGAEGDESEESAPARRKRNERPKDDVVLDEAFNILADLVRLNGGQELPQPRGWWE